MGLRLTSATEAQLTRLGLTRADIAIVIGDFTAWESDAVSGMQHVGGEASGRRLDVFFVPSDNDLLVARVEVRP